MDTFKRAQAFIRYAKRHDINLGEDTITYHWTGVEGHGAFYGISNIFEFVAEAPTNPRFQKFLATSNQFASRWEKLKEVVSKLGDTIAQMFGVKPADAKLLNNALSVTTRLIEKQAATNIQAILDRQAMASEEKAFKYSKLEKVPGMGVVIGKMAEYTEQAIRTFNPEALGKEAKEAASIIVKAVAEQMQKDSANTTHSLVRRKFWLRNMDNAEAFIDWYERGAKFKDPKFEEIGEYYKGWNERMAAQDKGTEFEYNEQDHYFAHLFKEGPAAINWLKQQTKKWGDPSFIKDRTFDLYSQARKAGFTPLFDNPEDIMLMRQHASDVAEMKVQTLRDMEAYGIAVKMTKEKHNAPNYPATQWRSPNGDWYWVHNNAYAVMHNAWNTKGLWELQGAAGDLFKGAMELKNRIVPIRLMGSLFHPLHVTSIDNATTMMRASKELLSGKINPLEWGRKMAEGVFYKDILTETFHTVNPFQARGGNRLLQVWQGKLRPEDLTNQDKQNIQYMFEGGLIPETAAQYRSHSIKSLKEAIAARSPTVLWHAPWAAIEATQGLLFQHWIPSLKIASYLKDVQTALKTDPKLIDDSRARGLAFRKLAMSVDNRYGEMPYNTLFWNKWVKDTAVASTLSLGWQLGFIREYGGGMLDIGQALREGGTLPEKAAKGMLDRPMFVLFYTAQALGYGGLMTYALSGKPPSEPIDYFFPKTGDKDANGKDSRVGTMFYTKEFYSIFKHIQAQGVGKGLEDTVIAKGSGLVGLVAESWTGMNSFGQEIRSEGSPAYKQVEETLLYVLGDIKPITAQSLARGTGTERSRVLAYSGFTPAPAYVTDTATEGRIKARFHNIYESKGTPFERAEFSREAAEAKKAYRAGDSGTASKLIDELIRKHDPQGTDPGLEARLIKSWEQAEAKGLSPTIKMFARMDAPDQKVLLDKMAPQEREVYLEHAKRSLRNSYEPPK